MEKIKEQIKKNKKIIYLAILLIIVGGIVCIYFQRLNFTLMYSDNTRIDLYIGKDYKIEDIKQIAKDVLGNQPINYQKIETFNDSVAITVKEASEEQINSLKQQIKEKYEIEEDSFLKQTQVPHLRARDMVKPYLIPTIMVTLLILGYVGVRFMRLGALKSMFLLGVKLVAIELVYLGIIGIVKIPIGMYTIPIAILIYLITVMAVVIGYQNSLEKREKKELEEKKNRNLKK